MTEQPPAPQWPSDPPMGQQPPAPQWPAVPPTGELPPVPQWPAVPPTGELPPAPQWPAVPQWPAGVQGAGAPVPTETQPAVPVPTSGGQPAGQGPVVPQWPTVPQAGPRPVSYPAPVRVEVVPGTPYGLAVLGAPKTASGVAASSLTTGIGSVLVSLAVWCFGLTGAEQGWGGLVAGAFAVLAILLGAAGIVLGWLGVRQIRLAAGAMTGRGVSISGLVCGAVGFLLAAFGLIVAIALSAGV